MSTYRSQPSYGGAEADRWGHLAPARGNLIGRGRLLLTAVMICLALVAYLSRRGPGPVNATLPAPAAAPRLHQPLSAMEDKAYIHDRFGGQLTGSGHEMVVTLAAKLAGVLPTGVMGAFDVGILQDGSSARAFAFEDGTIWLTRGLLERLETEGEVAAALCQEMERIETALRAPADKPPAGSLSVQMLAGAGYDPQAILNIQPKLFPVTGQVATSLENRELEWRVASLQKALRNRFPQGVPANLKP